jgi:hypothetical protein
MIFVSSKNRESAVGIVTGYGLDERGVEFQSRWGQDFLLLLVVQTGSGAHPESYPICSFPVGKAAGARSWPLTSN